MRSLLVSAGLSQLDLGRDDYYALLLALISSILSEIFVFHHFRQFH